MDSDDWIFGEPPNANEIVEGQIFIGNLTGARSLKLRKELGITHILSVCDQYPSTGANHLVIPIDDVPSADILTQLCRACQFIENALQKGGRILVHCAAGISRSPTVVAAYLMKTRKMSHLTAIRFMAEKRPQVCPNRGFVMQLEVFGQCNYDPSPSHAAFTKWESLRRRTVRILYKLYASTNSQVPEEVLVELEITHILSVSPSQISSAIKDSWLTMHHISVSENQHDILTALPEACKFIRKAIKDGGQVLVHSPVESRAALVLCAFVMFYHSKSPRDAYLFLVEVFPSSVSGLWPTLRLLLTLFEDCGCAPTLEHPLIKEWIASNLDDSAHVASTKWECHQPVKFGRGACDGSILRIVPDELYASINSQVSEELILDFDITHILSVSPSQISSAIKDFWLPKNHHHHHHHINVSENQRDILIALPEALKFIRKAIEDGGEVLVHSPVESRVAVVLCAYMMLRHGLSPGDAYSFIVEDFFPSSASGLRPSLLPFLGLFEDCRYAPTLKHPLVKDWIAWNLEDSEDEA